MSDNTLKQNSIDQIRDIIVGEQLDGFKDQIQKLQNSLKDLEKLNQTFSKKSSELLKQLEKVKQEKIDKNEIAEMLLTIANSLKKQ